MMVWGPGNLSSQTYCGLSCFCFLLNGILFFLSYLANFWSSFKIQLKCHLHDGLFHKQSVRVHFLPTPFSSVVVFLYCTAWPVSVCIYETQDFLGKETASSFDSFSRASSSVCRQFGFLQLTEWRFWGSILQPLESGKGTQVQVWDVPLKTLTEWTDEAKERQVERDMTR